VLPQLLVQEALGEQLAVAVLDEGEPAGQDQGLPPGTGEPGVGEHESRGVARPGGPRGVDVRPRQSDGRPVAEHEGHDAEGPRCLAGSPPQQFGHTGCMYRG
jgi:hypothetical protein